MSRDHNLSAAAGLVVASAIQNTRNLFCPYCADGFLFEFTLKDHLKAHHANEIKTLVTTNSDEYLSMSMQHCQHYCPFCSAAFNHLGLIPKHISDYHGNDLLHMWQRQSGTAERLQTAKDTEPSILYAACSPGLSAIFQQMETDASTATVVVSTAPKLKSILKKPPSKRTSIIRPTTPNLQPAVTIRRSKSDVVKRSLSVRRELRFDPNTKRAAMSPVRISSAIEALSPNGQTNKRCGFKMLRNPFRSIFRRIQTTGKPATATACNRVCILIRGVIFVFVWSNFTLVHRAAHHQHADRSSRR